MTTALAQDDDSEDDRTFFNEDDGSEDGGSDDGGNEVSEGESAPTEFSGGWGGLLPFGSDNYEELGGGIFGQEAGTATDSTDGMDYQDSKRRSFFFPSPFKRNDDRHKLFINNGFSNLQPEVPNTNQRQGQQSAGTPKPTSRPRDPIVRFLMPGQEDNMSDDDVNHQSEFDQELNREFEEESGVMDTYDQEKRERYAGYGGSEGDFSPSSASSLGGGVSSSGLGVSPSHDAHFSLSQDFDRFPKGSYFGMNEFYPESSEFHPGGGLRGGGMGQMGGMMDLGRIRQVRMPCQNGKCGDDDDDDDERRK